MGCGTVLFVAASLTAPDAMPRFAERVTIPYIVVAGDPFRPVADRLKAVAVLRKLDTPAALDFMADYVLVVFNIDYYTGHGPPPRDTLPFLYSLLNDARGQPRREDTAVAAAIFGALDKPRRATELDTYATILCSVLTDREGNDGSRRARALVAGELDRRPGALRRRNLEAMLALFDRNNGLDDAGRLLPRSNP